MSEWAIQEWIKRYERVVAENAKLRAVVDAARVVIRRWEYVMDEEYHKNALQQALDDLDKEGGE